MEPIDITLRVKSSGPLRRAGLNLAPVGAWHICGMQRTPQGAQTALALVLDPNIQVQVGEPDGQDEKGENRFIWHPAPNADDLRAYIADAERAEKDLTGAWMQDLDLDDAGKMPPVDPMLEREPDTPAPVATVGSAAEEVQQPAPGAQEETPGPGADQNNPSGSEAGPTEGAADAGAGSEEGRDPPPAEEGTSTETPSPAPQSAKSKAKAKPEA